MMKSFCSLILCIILSFVIIFPRSQSLETIHETLNVKRTILQQPVPQHLEQPVPQHLEEVCILVTDAATGVGRAIALQLADMGVHVLAGVKTEGEKRSFLFSSKKGFETVIFDLTDPALVASTVYRIQQLQTEWNRRFFGIVLNLADTMNEWKTNIKSEEQEPLVDVDAFDTSYRMIVRSSIRLLQGTMMLLTDDTTTTLPRKRHGKSLSNQSNQGGRIVTLLSTQFQSLYQGCGTLCIHQHTLSVLLQQMRMEYVEKNVSVSMVLVEKGDYGTQRGSMVNRAIHESIEWTIDATHFDGYDYPDATLRFHDLPGNLEDHRTLPILHALFTPYPKTIYGESNTNGGDEISSVYGDLGDTMNSTSTTTTTSSTSTATGLDKTDSTSGGLATPPTPSLQSPLVYIHIYNPVRTYLKHILQHRFHISFGDEDRDHTCVLTPPLLHYDYIAPYTKGNPMNHCRTVGREYFSFRMKELTVRWLFEKIMSREIRKYLLDQGMVELVMTEEE